jgi:orotate phosphoribosyltransferase
VWGLLCGNAVDEACGLTTEARSPAGDEPATQSRVAPETDGILGLRAHPVSQLSEKVLELFRRTGAYLEGHFRLTSGLHSPEYLQCALVLQHPRYAELLGQKLAAEIRRIEPIRDIDVVVSPAMGGLIIGHEVARALNTRHIFTERVDAKMTLRRGFGVQKGERAVVIEDVVTTGGSSLEVVELLKAQGVDVVCAGSIIDRSGGRADVTVPRVALATLHVMSYDATQCPLCAQGLPVVKPGSRPTA